MNYLSSYTHFLIVIYILHKNICVKKDNYYSLLLSRPIPNKYEELNSTLIKSINTFVHFFHLSEKRICNSLKFGSRNFSLRYFVYLIYIANCSINVCARSSSLTFKDAVLPKVGHVNSRLECTRSTRRCCKLATLSGRYCNRFPDSTNSSRSLHAAMQLQDFSD